MIEALLFVFFVWLFFKLLKTEQPQQDDETDDFDLMTLSEKFETTRQTNESLHSMEQLITDMDLCSEDNQTVIQVSWVGDDGESYAYDLYCDGMNTTTECIRAIAERETHDLRRVLSYQCNALAMATRSRKNGGKNGAEIVGEWLENDAV